MIVARAVFGVSLILGAAWDVSESASRALVLCYTLIFSCGLFGDCGVVPHVDGICCLGVYLGVVIGRVCFAWLGYTHCLDEVVQDFQIGSGLK